MDFSQALNIAQLANALALASLLTILASGLALIFGLRDVMNFGHGALFMLGAYLGYTFSGLFNFWAALVIVPLLLALLGVLFEYAAIRPLQRRSHMDVALVTFGLALILSQVVIKVWGTAPLSVSAPPSLAGSLDLFGHAYPAYRIFLIAMGFGTCVLLAAWLKWTRSGMHVRAVSQQPMVARMMGVNTDRLSLLVVCLGTGFAGLAGVLAGPYLSVDPAMGSSILISCLIVVVIGGLGSIGGAIAAAVVFGLIQVIGALISPTLAVMAPYLLLFIVLLWRPQGLGRGRVA
ncbi:branched-chain amino acid transport system permease protein [Variovorax sp. OK605]|jgi:branched-chain amino acid transport system permease protein|uniref:branched-chain amino acid ABC transporter permease n=1 Tax=unclassified Variovorax TaxID=663243 RepID=UPI0008B86530|nr:MULTISPECIES: branched-chain amino acid ABC transporter permease [unclassified Variovorax]SEK12095.1 amino acid/amide ABC transporter membrane protein 1, HAAT family [Variovorax sp. OK202]SFD79187.1 amino acid/amide ABC transporter membrane protein 1, HAAT family [Variovorax sp. OK212]SFP56987.1 branched-chain amino acid transport system permease protein [Variovorax sp. OK605]